MWCCAAPPRDTLKEELRLVGTKPKGCTVGQLLQFWVTAHRVGRLTKRSSIEELLRRTVLRETAERRCCYVDLLPGEARRPCKLVEQWSGASFYGTVVSIVRDAAGVSRREAEDIVDSGGKNLSEETLNQAYWLRFFAENQHDELFDSRAVDDIFKQATHGVLVVLDPGLRVLERVECLNTIFRATVRAKAITYSASGTFDASVLQRVETLDLEQSQAPTQEAKEQFCEEVASQAGFSRLNEAVRAAVRAVVKAESVDSAA